MNQIVVLLAAYNGENWIGEQLHSVLAQRGVSVSVVVRDDGSSDGTRKVVEAFANADPRVTLLDAGPPSGSASGNFFCLLRNTKLVGTDAIAFCDQDDVWMPNKLLNAVTILKKSGAAGVSSAVLARWENRSDKLLKQSSIQRDADFIFEGAGQGCTFVLSTAFVTRVQSFLATVDVARQMHFHDWCVYLLARTWNLQWVFDANPSMYYRQHETNDIGARGGLHGVTRRISMIRSGWYAGQIKRAGAIYYAAGGCNIEVLKALQRIEERGVRSRAASVRLAIWLLKYGRRRLSDRVVLCGVTMMRWI